MVAETALRMDWNWGLTEHNTGSDGCSYKQQQKMEVLDFKWIEELYYSYFWRCCSSYCRTGKKGDSYGMTVL